MTPPVAAADFLQAAGWGGAQILPLAGDASFRRYFRVQHDARRAVLMDAPPPQEDVGPFLAIARHLTAVGFRAPSILAEDRATGLLLIEDLGDARMRETIDDNPSLELPLYEAAVDLLAVLQAHPPADLPPYDMPVLQREAGLLTEWFCPAAGLDVDLAAYAAAWDEVLPQVDVAEVTVLRDYHAENIMLLEDGALGLLDFQDALAGHRAYDLVSLLQDARRDVPEAVEVAMLDRFCTATGAGADFRPDYAILGAQRNAKIVGIFTRLWKRDGKPRYLDLLPRVWRYLDRDLAHPSLAPVAAWFDANIPHDKRGTITP
ncbi:aminoglycoside phosphotransferase family protein [Sphingomonas antarctica]|uniref:aminoglycoside phosphotransferase family protein n=1 Tax=Sphingomonas antarctica TaxID=2040274 RepID=UPI0039E8097D